MNTINPTLKNHLEKDEEKRQEIWDNSVKLFHQNKFKESITELKRYLAPDAEITEDDGKSKFAFKQGSVTVYCRFTNETFYAYVNLLKVEYPDPIVFRRLLNLNASEFTQTKASIVKDFIRLTTETLLELCSPTKIYWDLHELATQGDKLDDLLSIYSKGVKEISPPENIWSEESQKIGSKFIRKWIEQSLKKAQFWYAKNDLYAASWWLIGRIFSVLYFIHPEGKLCEELNDIVDDYNNQDRSQEENIKRVILRLRKILEMSDEELNENFFHVRRTFLTMKPASSDVLTKYLESSLNSADRFKSLGHKESEYMALIYGLGLLLNNLQMENSFTEEMIRIYEMAHLDFMQVKAPEVLLAHFDKNLNLYDKVKRVFKNSKKPLKMNLETEKDKQTIIRYLRTFYDRALNGEF